MFFQSVNRFSREDTDPLREQLPSCLTLLTLPLPEAGTGLSPSRYPKALYLVLPIKNFTSLFLGGEKAIWSKEWFQDSAEGQASRAIVSGSEVE